MGSSTIAKLTKLVSGVLLASSSGGILRTAPSFCSGMAMSTAGSGGKQPIVGNIDSSKVTANAPRKRTRKQRPRIPVLQYHDEWVCVSKPAGLTVHKTRNTRRATLSSTIKRQLSRKVFPVHRLDHRTSGAILFAFDSETCGKLHSALRVGTKQYVALLRGEWRHDNESVTVDKPLRVDDIDKEAITKFTLLASGVISSGNSNGSGNKNGSVDNNDEDEDVWYDPSRCSLVLCEPKTGRTHQIRRHAAALSQPVLGDTEHGDTKVNRWWRQNRGLDRLALHCLSLDLPPLGNGTDEERTICVAPLPLDLSSVLQHPDLADLWRVAIEKEPRLIIEPIDDRGGTFGRNYRDRTVVEENNTK